MRGGGGKKGGLFPSPFSFPLSHPSAFTPEMQCLPSERIHWFSCFFSVIRLNLKQINNERGGVIKDVVKRRRVFWEIVEGLTLANDVFWDIPCWIGMPEKLKSLQRSQFRNIPKLSCFVWISLFMTPFCSSRWICARGSYLKERKIFFF